MRELVEYIAKSIVDYPEQVTVDEVEGSNSLVLELKVHPDDMGKVIGKQGRVAKSIRTVVNAAAFRENRRVAVEIVQ